MLELVLAAARFLHYAATIQLFGVAVFVAFIAPGAMGAWMQRLAEACAGLLVLTSITWLGVASMTMADGVDVPTLWLVLTGTQFGHVWIAVLVLDVLLIIAVAVRAWVPLTVLSAAMLAALGLVGHLAAAEGAMSVVGRASQVVHLLAAGYWLGSLVPLAMCLKAGPNAEAALVRFSGLGHVAVALALATGLINTWIVIGGLPTDFSSVYQLLLAIKVALVLAMIGLALVNRYVLMPRLRGDGTGRLQRTIIGEIVLGAVVIAVVSVLGTLPPV